MADMLCENCDRTTDILLDVVTDDQDTEIDERWCPSCVAGAVAEEFTDLDPREVDR